MKGLVLAAGNSRRMQDLTTKRNKVLLDMGGKTVLDNLLDQFAAAAVAPVYVTAGFDAQTVKRACRDRATVLYNPFHEHYGILSSLWIARSELYATPFLVSVGDHYIEQSAVVEFRKSQPDAAILLHVEMKKCDDEDMKVFIDASHHLVTISKIWNRSNVKAIGEFSGMVRFSPAGSRLFFDTLAEFAWTRELDGNAFMADVFMACHQRQPLAFHVSSDHRRMDIDYPTDFDRACELFRTRPIIEPPVVEAPAATPVAVETENGEALETGWTTPEPIESAADAA